MFFNTFKEIVPISCSLSNSCYVASITVKPKPNKDITRKLQLYGRHKYHIPLQNISRSTVYKKVYVSLLSFLAKIMCNILIILISDISSIQGQYSKWIFGAERWKRSLLHIHFMHQTCSISRNGVPPQDKKKKKYYMS